MSFSDETIRAMRKRINAKLAKKPERVQARRKVVRLKSVDERQLTIFDFIRGEDGTANKKKICA
jgi:hypothetical protein